MNNTLERLTGATFQLTLALVAMLAPMFLVVYAFEAFSGSLARAHMIVHGSELIVGGLFCALALRAAYLLGASRAYAFPQSSRIQAIEMA